MNTIVCSRTVSMGHRLPSYDGICSSPHGHNMKVSVSLITRKFVDFKEVDAKLDYITSAMDHAMVLHEKDSRLVKVLLDMDFRVVVLSQEPTTECIAQYVYNEMHKLLKEYHTSQLVELQSVSVQETEKYSAVCFGPYKDAVRRVK